jgi:THO complex subunit 2
METESCSLKNSENENSMDIQHPLDVHYIESPGLHDLKAEILHALPSSTWRDITVEFFISFWQLSLYDISVPKSLYQLELDKQSAIIANLNADKSDMSKAAISKRSREKDRASSIIHSLKEELKAQEVNYGKIAARIDSEKNRWFKNEISAEVSLNLLQDFIYQRCLISPYDATFCALFLFLMHSIKVPRFSIMSTLSNLFKPEITQALTFSSTENESKNFGKMYSIYFKGTLCHLL